MISIPQLDPWLATGRAAGAYVRYFAEPLALTAAGLAAAHLPSGHAAMALGVGAAIAYSRLGAPRSWAAWRDLAAAGLGAGAALAAAHAVLPGACLGLAAMGVDRAIGRAQAEGLGAAQGAATAPLASPAEAPAPLARRISPPPQEPLHVRLGALIGSEVPAEARDGADPAAGRAPRSWATRLLAGLSLLLTRAVEVVTDLLGQISGAAAPVPAAREGRATKGPGAAAPAPQPPAAAGGADPGRRTWWARHAPAPAA